MNGFHGLAVCAEAASVKQQFLTLPNFQQVEQKMKSSIKGQVLECESDSE
jgi:hypothetical protein